MTDDEPAGSGGATPSPDLVEQLRMLMSRLAGVPVQMSESLAHATAGLPGIARPGALSAAQMSSLSSSIAAQRATIAALRTQLDAFDEQLAVLEQLVEPLSKMAGTWAEMERALLGGGKRG